MFEKIKLINNIKKTLRYIYEKTFTKAILYYYNRLIPVTFNYL